MDCEVYGINIFFSEPVSGIDMDFLKIVNGMLENGDLLYYERREFRKRLKGGNWGNCDEYLTVFSVQTESMESIELLAEYMEKKGVLHTKGMISDIKPLPKLDRKLENMQMETFLENLREQYLTKSHS